jgi:tetratricopeptide (TPR) repeat protein
MGQVWLARDGELGDEIALKILQPRLLSDAAMIELMRHECRQARRLLHPGIVRVFDFHQADGLAFISMEYVEGGELGQLRDAAPAEILVPLVPLTDALAYAHGQGVIHRDLKPSNVLLEGPARPRLLDFGIAAALDASAGLSPGGGGTRLSASPEQRQGLPPSPADDAFALGVLIHELVSGFPPETGPGLEPPALRSRMNFDVPERLQQLVVRLLAWEARARFADMEEIGRELDDILQSCRGQTAPPRIRIPATPASIPSKGAGTAGRAPPRSEPTRAPGSGVTAWVWAAFAVLLMLLAAVVFVLPRQVAKQPPPVAGDLSPPAMEEAVDLEAMAASKKAADEALVAYQRRRRELLGRGAEDWGAAGLADAGIAADAAQRAYRGAAYDDARRGWDEAAGKLAALDGRGDELRAAARARGQAALIRGDRELAEHEFGLALTIDPEDQVARKGLERASRIERVIQLMREGERLEAGGRLRDAASVYRQAAELDPDLTEAGAAVARVDAALVQRGFAEAMSRGYRAIDNGAYDEAVKAFRQAARVRPGAPEPEAGLAAARAAETLETVQSLAARAGEMEGKEQWRQAADAYRQILATDPGVVLASQGLERASARADMDESLQSFLADPERLYAPDGIERARAALAAAEGVENPGPRLRAQRVALEAMVAKAVRPVQVWLESDNLTEVVVYRVGRLGSFERKNLELRPGDYTVVGTREGYRDVRRELQLRPGMDRTSVTIRCEEPI